MACFHLARLEIAVAAIQKDCLGYSGIQDRLGGDSQPAAAAQLHLDIDKHLGLEPETGVGKIQADFQRSRCRIDLRL